LKTLLLLLAKDFRRDFKRPWSILMFATLPLAMTALIAAVFGNRSAEAPIPTIHVAVWDADEELLGGLLRFASTQGAAAEKLRLHFVKNRDEGIYLLERRRASAFAVLPDRMTEDLLDGKATAIEFYENPAEQFLPKVARQGVTLLAAGLSAGIEVLREPLRDIQGMIKAKDFPADVGVTQAALQSAQILRRYDLYLFPPLIDFETISADDYQLQGTNTPSPGRSP
jgi:hypothetical protein